MGCSIRKYKAEDKEDLRDICRKTAGKPFTKREKLIYAVPIIYNDYFTENEPENIFVAADENNRAVGYIICSKNRELFKKQMLKKYIPEANKADSGMIPACLGYMTVFFLGGRKSSVHLHIDILPEYQKNGTGTKLIDSLRSHLYKSGINTLSVIVISRKAPAYGFYKKYGFKESGHYIGSLVSLSISTKTESEGKE